MMEQMSSSTSGDAALSSADSKIVGDLRTLSEQMDLCQQMMVQQGGPPIDTGNEALLGVVGFLEACVPRMVELVEAGVSQQALFQSEETLGECLEANDRLNRLLEALVKDDDKIFETSAAAAAARPSPSAGGELDLDLDDLVLDDEKKPASVALKSDVFDTGEMLQPTPMKSSADSADDFDAFLNERVSSSAKHPL